MSRGACQKCRNTTGAEVRNGSEPPTGMLGPGLRSSARSVGPLDQSTTTSTQLHENAIHKST